MESTPTTATGKTAILGFGNPVRADDGVGIYVVEQLKQQIGEPEHISIFDMGTSAFEVLFQLKGHERIILVDAVMNTGEPVGSVFKLPAPRPIPVMVASTMLQPFSNATNELAKPISMLLWP